MIPGRTGGRTSRVPDGRTPHVLGNDARLPESADIVAQYLRTANLAGTAIRQLPADAERTATTAHARQDVGIQPLHVVQPARASVRGLDALCRG